YQGGDQLWHYTTAWVMGQGRLPHTSIGYAWSIVLLPFALIGGPNLIGPIPFILLLNVLVLMPVALLATYGIGVRLGGRLFGYWVAALWILVPLIGIKYANAGYHQRYTEQLLPQSLGLTVMSDFPSMVAGVVSAYFALRALQDDDPWDGVMAGLVAGVAIGIKPSNAPVVVGIGLALVAARRWRSIAYTAAGIAPSIVALAVWKARGEGNLPLFRSGLAGSHLIVAHAAPVLAIGLHSYFHPSWTFFSQQLDSIREHFWSVRVLEWLAIAGTIGLLRRSRPAALLFGGWFFSMVAVKWMSAGHGTVDDSDLLRQTISAIPAFLIILAGVVLLVPGLARRLPRPDPSTWDSHRARVACIAAIGSLFCAVPVALAAALPVLSKSDTISYYTQ
ncbi:MAG: glycosyltransferase family 39 protein, partial [Gaiellaceae bacterium]